MCVTSMPDIIDWHAIDIGVRFGFAPIGHRIRHMYTLSLSSVHYPDPAAAEHEALGISFIDGPKSKTLYSRLMAP
jgi:hypothetical protein